MSVWEPLERVSFPKRSRHAISVHTAQEGPTSFLAVWLAYLSKELLFRTIIKLANEKLASNVDAKDRADGSWAGNGGLTFH